MKFAIKVLKFSFKVAAILILVAIIANYGFKIKEYFEGKKYVSYWESNPEKMETTEQNKSFEFKLLEKIAYENDLILFGESHGTKEAQRIDFQLIKYLNKKVGMTNHIVELDFSQTYFINQYLKNGNDTLINYVLKSWIVFMGRNNKDYHSKWKKLKQYNNTLPDNQKVKIIGIDKIQDFEITRKHISVLFKKLNINIEIPNQEDVLIEWSVSVLNPLIQEMDTSNQNEILKDLLFIQENIANYKQKSRSEFLFANFKKQYYRYGLTNKKIYGYFGLGHVIQKGVNNYDDFGALLKKSSLPIKNKTFSIITLILDSYMGVPSEVLPEPMRDDSEITKMTYTFDAPLIWYFYGVNDLRKVTEEKSNTLFIINGKNSPYSKSLRLIDSFGLLPIFPEIIKITAKNSVSTDYCQGVILIRNSDWAEPMKH